MSVNEKMTALADAIREKSGVTGKLTIDGMTSAVKAISSLIVASASGNPIVLNDSTDLRVQSLRLFGKTTQNGTPTPEAPVPLVSAGDGGSLGVTVAGKNLCPGFKAGAYSAGSGVFLEGLADYYCTELISVMPGIVYTESNNTGKMVADTHFFTKDKKWIGKEAYTTSLNNRPDGTAYVAFNYWKTAELSWVQLEAGATATEYEPYKEPQTLPVSTPNGLPGIPVTSGGNYTDSDGQQWVCDEVDFARGVYVQRIGEWVLNGSEKWVLDSGGKIFYYVEGYSDIIPTPSAGEKPPLICDHYETRTANEVSSSASQYNKVGIGHRSNQIRINNHTADVAAFVAGLQNNPVRVLYAKATPNETALSAEELAAYAALHTNYPNTTIFNDGGAGMEVSYVADTKNYIDNQIASVAAAIVNA